MPTQKQSSSALFLLARVVMLILVLASSLVFFSWTAINFLPDTDRTLAYTQAYIQAQLEFLFPYLPALLAVIAGLVIFTTLSYRKREKKIDAFKVALITINNLTLTLIAISLGLIFSADLVFALFTHEIRAVGSKLNQANTSDYFITDVDAISSQLSSNEHAPVVWTDKKTQNKNIINLYLQNSDKSVFFKSYLADYTPPAYYPPLTISAQPVFLFQDQLFLTRIDETLLETIGPLLARLWIQDYFPGSEIKDNPKIDVISRQDFLAKREEEIADLIDQSDSYIKEAQDTIVKLQNEIAFLQGNIAEWQARLSATQDFVGTYYGADETEVTNFFLQAIDSNQEYIDKYTTLILDYENYIAELQSTRTELQNKNETVALEWGLFTPPDQIEIALDEGTSRPLESYLGTLLHEYLHFTVYKESKTDFNPFFNEGLTSYFADRILQANVDVSGYGGYPLVLPIIQQMQSDIPAPLWAEIYFLHDQDLLVKTLDQVYGEDFYENNLPKFNYIVYTYDDTTKSMAAELATQIDTNINKDPKKR